jgi:hypothetical protein
MKIFMELLDFPLSSTQLELAAFVFLLKLLMFLVVMLKDKVELLNLQLLE